MKLKVYVWRFYKPRVIEYDGEPSDVEQWDGCVPFAVENEAGEIVWGNVSREFARVKEAVRLASMPAPQRERRVDPVSGLASWTTAPDEFKSYREHRGLYEEQLRDLMELFTDHRRAWLEV